MTAPRCFCVLLFAFVIGACIQDPAALSYGSLPGGDADVILDGDVSVEEVRDSSARPDLPADEDVVDGEDTRDVRDANGHEPDVSEEVSFDQDAEVDSGPPPPQRVTEGLLLYYPFLEGAGRTSADQSRVSEALDLTIEGHHSWLNQGGLQFLSGEDQPIGRAHSEVVATKVRSHMIEGKPFTVELWITVPAMVGGIDYGPGRIFALAPGGASSWSQDYFAVGTYSEGGLDVLGSPYLCFRFHNSTATQVEIVVEPPTEAPVHYVLTYDGAVFRLYQDEVEIEQRSLDVNFANWAYDHHIRVGNSAVESRQFPGEIHLIAMYDRALSVTEVGENYASRWPTPSP